jgi:hypothetical protein
MKRKRSDIQRKIKMIEADIRHAKRFRHLKWVFDEKKKELKSLKAQYPDYEYEF